MKRKLSTVIHALLSATVIFTLTETASGTSFKRSDATTDAPTLKGRTSRPRLRAVKPPTPSAFDALSRVNPVRPPMKMAPRDNAQSYNAPSFITAYACLTYSGAWSTTSAFPYQIVTVSPNNTAMNTIAMGSQFAATNGAVYTPDGYFTAVAHTVLGMVLDMNYYISDPETFDLVGTWKGSMNIDPSAMTYDPTSGLVFTCYTDGNAWIYGTFDISSLTYSETKRFEETEFSQWMAMTVDGNGQLYAVNLDGMLLKVDKLTGDYSLVGDTGLRPQYGGNAAYDPNSGKTYFVMSNAAGTSMNELNLTTGAATHKYYFPDEKTIAGMFFYPLDVPDGAPANATSLTADFADGSLSGTLQFEIPATTADGAAGTGNVSYKVLVDGTTANEGTSSFGQTVNASLTIEKSGYHTLGVILSNDKGESTIQTIRAFIGEDSPTSVKDLTATYTNGQFKISWSAPAGTNGGYINPDKLKYRVTRLPDETVVADELSTTEYTDNITVPDESVSYSYTVTVIYDGEAFASATSNATIVGSIVPPYSESFDSQSSLSLFTIENTNGDSAKWGYSKRNACLIIEYSYGGSSHNDWIFTPAIKVEKGRNYVIAFDAWSFSAQYPEQMEVSIGSQPASDAMTTTVIESFTIASSDATRYSGVYHAEETGTIYVGLHAISGGDKAYTLKVDNLSVSAGIDMSAPAQPTNVTVTPDAAGHSKATVRFDAPSIDVKGNELQSIDKITIKRNDVEIASLQAAPGETVEFEDSNEDGGIVNGENTYVIVAENQAGTGTPFTIKCFIGFGEPAQVAGASVVPGEDYGKVVVSWQPVTTDVNGHNIPAERIYYIVTRVVGNSQEIVYRGTDLTFTDRVCGPQDLQRFVYYGIQAATGDDIMTEIGEYGTSALIPVGCPDSTPWIESFKSQSISHSLGSSAESGAQWVIVGDSDVDGVKSLETDNGMAVMTSATENPAGESSTLSTGRISLSALTRPYLTFYYYGYQSANTLELLIDDGSGFKTVKTITMSDTDAWARCEIDLSDYAGKDVIIGLRGTINDNPLIAVDRISIDNIYDNDLRAESISASSRVDPGEDFKISIAYRNYGLQKASNYKLSIFINDEMVNSVDGPELVPGAGVQVGLNANLSILGERINNIHYTLDWNADEAPDDNKSEKAQVAVRIPYYPVVNDLTGDSDETTATLAWSDPDLSAAPYSVTTEDVENMPAFSIGLPDSDVENDNVGNWTMLDADGAVTYTISGDYYFTNQGRPFAFIVFDSSAIGLDWRLTPHSGKQMFVAMASIGAENDDWLISPELSGDAQEITFWAWNADRYYGAENLEVLYSTTGKSPDDFVSLTNIYDVPGSWTEYACNLPEGAKYFALRRTSNNTFIFCLDDIRFIAAGAEKMPLSVVGYNVYRNGDLITDEPLVANDYSDTMLPDGDNDYIVSVVYDLGESGASNKVTLRKQSGISSANTAKAAVYAEGMTIVVNGGEGKHLDIVSPSGIIVYSAENCNDARVAVAAHGVYLVRLGVRVYKVVI